MITNNNEVKASTLIKKIVGICLLFIFLAGICVFASNTQVKNVKIVLANGYEMDVMTSKTKVSEILENEHIILLPDEKVVPSEDTELGDTKTIKILKKSQEEEVVELAQKTEEINIEEIKTAYAPVVEKIVVEQVPIPFETITKDASKGSKEIQNRVLQEGKEGIKEITYKIKYQNEKELERVELSSKVIQEPVNKIIQVKATTTRSSRTARAETTTAKGVSLGKYRVTAYCGCAKCCGKSTGRTASGKMATANHTIAAPGRFAFGTKIKINGIVYTVEDRGGAIQGNRIDIYFASHQQALNWGSRYCEIEVMN